MSTKLERLKTKLEALRTEYDETPDDSDACRAAWTAIHCCEAAIANEENKEAAR